MFLQHSADPKHRAFEDGKCVFISDFVDNVDIFQSMQRPRKLTVRFDSPLITFALCSALAPMANTTHFC